jgi:hypothetical protein
MTADMDGMGYLISVAAQCVAEGCPDLAIDHYLLAYRQGVSDIVSEMQDYDCPEVPLGPRWADDAAWIGWANLSLYHRAVSEQHEGLKLFDGLVPWQDELVLYGRYWVDEMDLRGRTVRFVLPDAYCHILVQLATREVFGTLLPPLISVLLDFGRWSEAKRHAADRAVLLRWRERISGG